MQDAAIEPSSPARYPDEVLANLAALSAEARNELTTSASGAGGAAGADAVLVAVVVRPRVDVGLTARRRDLGAQRLRVLRCARRQPG